MTNALALQNLPDPNNFASIGWLLIGLAALCFAANQILKFTDRFKDKPPASDVRAELVDKLTAKELFHAHVAQNLREHENIFSKIGGVERGSQAKIESMSREWRLVMDSKFSEMIAATDQGREKLHDRINEILSEVSELRGEMRAKR